MRTPTALFRGGLAAFASRLRFPKLVALITAVFVIDVLIPDMIPFADEILLGLLAAAMASFKKKGQRSHELKR